MKGFKLYSFNVIYEHNVENARFAKSQNVKRTATMEETTKVLGGCVRPAKKGMCTPFTSLHARLHPWQHEWVGAHWVFIPVQFNINSSTLHRCSSRISKRFSQLANQAVILIPETTSRLHFNTFTLSSHPYPYRPPHVSYLLSYLSIKHSIHSYTMLCFQFYRTPTGGDLARSPNFRFVHSPSQYLENGTVFQPQFVDVHCSSQN